MDSSNLLSMQSLLHSSSEEDHEILQQNSSDVNVNGTYPSDHPQMSYNAWGPFHAHSPTSLERKLEDYGNLRLPPDTIIDNSSSISRFMTDEASSRPLVELNSSPSISHFFLNNSHNLHPIAPSWGGYQSSYHDDASSAVSSVYDYRQISTETASAWAGSPDSHPFRDNYSLSGTSPTSPVYPRGHTCGGNHSHRSSMDACLSPSSPGLGPNQAWGGAPVYSGDSNSGSSSPRVAPDAIASEISLSNRGSFVNPKNIQLAPTNEEKDDDDDDDEAAEEGLLSRGFGRESVPDIRFHKPERDDRNSWPNERGYYRQSPIGTGCSSPLSSPQSPVRPSNMLEMNGERRSRSGSGASQLSAKGRAEMMKPFKDIGKSHKGRGAGKKQKERQSCPAHPNKSFKHNSEFRKHMQTQHTRPFLCTFYFAGCGQTFGSKNEWKRHVFSQHLRLHYWRCDDPDCADRNAIFNRKDLFGQHLKRMHSPKPTGTKSTQQAKSWLTNDIPKIQERCLHTRRSPPEWSKCGYCKEKFSGHGSWDTRMEHVGKHYEKNNHKGIDPESWVMDDGLIQWAVNTKIVELMEDGKYRLLSSGKDFPDEEKRKSPNAMDKMIGVLHDGEEEDAEGELE